MNDNDATKQGSTSVIVFGDALPEPLHYSPPAERIVAGNPAQTAWNFFSSQDDRFHSGIWESQIGKWRVIFTESEFCYLLAGVIVITGDDGSVRTVRADDAFLTPIGFAGYWEVLEPARKYYAYYA